MILLVRRRKRKLSTKENIILIPGTRIQKTQNKKNNLLIGKDVSIIHSGQFRFHCIGWYSDDIVTEQVKVLDWINNNRSDSVDCVEARYEGVVFSANEKSEEIAQAMRTNRRE